MLGRRVLAGVAATACLAAAVPATAGEAMRKAPGRTNQGKEALVWARGDNSVALVKLKYVAVCRDKDFVWRDKIYFRDTKERPFTRDGVNFSDGGTFEAQFREGPASFTTQMAGGPSTDGGWKGTFKMTVRVYNKRRKLTDVCKTRTITWWTAPAGLSP